MANDRFGIRWAPYLLPTERDVVAALREARAAGYLTPSRVREQYALLHLPALLTLTNGDERATSFVDLLRWTIAEGGMSLEHETIARWSFFPDEDIPKLDARFRRAADEIARKREDPAPLTTKQVQDRESAVRSTLARHLLDESFTRRWEEQRGLTRRPPAPPNPYYGMNVEWDEWRIVLDRRTGTDIEHCYYNVKLRVVRSPERFLSIGYTSGDGEEPDDPVRIISSRAGHVMMQPVRDDKPTQRQSQQFIDAIYYGRTLEVGDVERVKWRRAVYRDIGEESWVSQRSPGPRPYYLDIRILLDPDEPIARWREECWSTQSPDARLLQFADHPVGARQPRLVRSTTEDAQPDRLYRLIIYPR